VSAPHYTLESAIALFCGFNEICWNGELQVELQVITPGDTDYLGRYCPCTEHGGSEDVIAIDLTQEIVPEILLHECVHCALYQLSADRCGARMVNRSRANLSERRHCLPSAASGGVGHGSGR